MKLKNCPFCGGGAKVKRSHRFHDYWVTCRREARCGIDGPFRFTEQGAIDAWNRRPPNGTAR